MRTLSTKMVTIIIDKKAVKVLRVSRGHLHYMRDLVDAGQPSWNDFHEGRFVRRVPSTYPDWFRDKGLRKKRILTIIDKCVRGIALTALQAGTLADLVRSSAQEYENACTWAMRHDRPWPGFLKSAGDFLDDAGGPGGMTVMPFAFARALGGRRGPSVAGGLFGMAVMSAIPATALGGADSAMTDRRGPPAGKPGKTYKSEKGRYVISREVMDRCCEREAAGRGNRAGRQR